jgi:hypothetical protein
MSPAEDAALLLGIVRRHLRTLRIGLDAAYPEEDWGFTAQQAAKKLQKAWIVLAEQPLDPRLAALQVFAVEARYEEGPFPLPASRVDLLTLLEAELARCERAVSAAG